MQEILNQSSGSGWTTVLAANLESFSEFRERCLWRACLEAASTAKACDVSLGDCSERHETSTCG